MFSLQKLSISLEVMKVTTKASEPYSRNSFQFRLLFWYLE